MTTDITTLHPETETDPLRPLVLAAIRKELDRKQRYQTRLDANRNLYRGILEAVEGIDFIRKELDLYGGLELGLTSNKDDLGKVIRALRRAGLTPAYRPKAGDVSWSTWWWDKNDTLAVWFSFTSKECRRVKVGETQELVTKDIYEVQCSDGGAELKDLIEEIVL